MASNKNKKSSIHFFLTPAQHKALGLIARAEPRGIAWKDPRVSAVTANSLWKKGCIVMVQNQRGDFYLHITGKGKHAQYL